MKTSSDTDQKTAANIKEYFKQLERRFQAGIAMAFFIPLVALSIYFHLQFDFSLRETGKLNLAAIAESQRNTVDLFLQERLVNIFSLFQSTEFSLTPSEQQMQQFLQNLRQVSDAFIDVGFLNADGQETLQALKQEHRWMEIVILTGHGTIDSAAACSRNGAYAYLQKPCEFDQQVA